MFREVNNYKLDGVTSLVADPLKLILHQYAQ